MQNINDALLFFNKNIKQLSIPSSNKKLSKWRKYWDFENKKDTNLKRLVSLDGRRSNAKCERSGG